MELFGFSEQQPLQATFIPDSFHFGNRRNIIGKATRGRTGVVSILEITQSILNANHAECCGFNFTKKDEWALGRSGLSSNMSKTPASDYVSPVCFNECMCTIAIFELRWHFELNRVMQSDTKLLSWP